MKINILFYKNILLYLDENFKPNKWNDIDIEGSTKDDISYAIKKLDEINIVNAINLTDSSGIEYKVTDITSKGYSIINKLKDVSDSELLQNNVTIGDLEEYLDRAPRVGFDDELIDFSDRIPEMENPYKVPIIVGIIVAIITVFILTPLKDIVLKNNSSIEINTEQFNTKQKAQTDTSNKVIESSKDSVNNKNIITTYLQSYDSKILFKGDLVVVSNSILTAINDTLVLKLNKPNVDTTRTVKLSLGDKYIYHNYEIIFLNVNRNISTYDAILQIKHLEDQIGQGHRQ